MTNFDSSYTPQRIFALMVDVSYILDCFKGSSSALTYSEEVVKSCYEILNLFQELSSFNCWDFINRHLDGDNSSYTIHVLATSESLSFPVARFHLKRFRSELTAIKKQLKLIELSKEGAHILNTIVRIQKSIKDLAPHLLSD